ncbi:MAG: hypothetical protein HY290_28675 [Planctomycetia bacterium]|nr:hypothetical protein [Planctomycetia bacterium]
MRRPDNRYWNARPQHHLRRGATYVAVLGCTLIVMTMGLAGLFAVRSQARASNTLNDAVDARLNAMTGIEFVRSRIAGNQNWRTTYSNGAWATSQPVGSGTFSVTVTNPNGALNHSPYDPVNVTATGVRNAATHISQVTLVAQPVPLTCLNAAATAGSAITLATTTVNGINQIMASNLSVTAVGLTPVYPNVEAVTSIVGTGFQGTTTTGVTARTMPDSTVFDYYTANGTAISVSSLGSPANLQNVVLSPVSNPYGAETNSQGIYVIDCLGQSVTVTQCRIVGTLVLLNAGALSSVQGNVYLSAAVSNYPCLLVQGSMTIQFDSTTTLKENQSPATNFNPAGSSPPATATPYPWGSSNYNLTTTDTYPSVIAGLVYVSGSVTIANAPAVNSLVVGGTLTTAGQLTLAYDLIYFNNPPPGFCTIPMVPSSGSWQQVVN